MNINKTTVVLVLLLVTVQAYAQPGGPTTPTPFGFVEILAGAGAIYGIKTKGKLLKKRAK